MIRVKSISRYVLISRARLTKYEALLSLDASYMNFKNVNTLAARADLEWGEGVGGLLN